MVLQTTQPYTDSAKDSQPSPPIDARQHLLTINVEDYFQAGVFQKFIQTTNWYRFESRLQRNVEHVLQLLEDHKTKATFFVLGWTAEKEPELVRRISDAGHEVASRGFLHQPILNLPKDQISQDLVRAKDVLEDVIGKAVGGFRLSDGWLCKDTLWLLNEVAAAGYRYDSSLMPKQRDFADRPELRSIHQIKTPSGPLLEIPLSTLPTVGGWLPVAGGNYHRQVPDFLMRRLVDRTVTAESEPFVMYFQVWELDCEQPRLSVADRITQLRHYRKLGKYQRTLPQYLQKYQFTSVRRHASLADSPLHILTKDAQPQPKRVDVSPQSVANQNRSAEKVTTAESAANQTTISIVIPCFNEESTLSYLGNTLESVTERLSDHWNAKIIFVDDCSNDGTFDALQQNFGANENVTVVRHETNQGVSAAILTGLRHADTDIVCSMDCDCSYDPHELANMLPLLTDDVAMVTASPYHRDGLVRNVPGWRLFLSRGLSAIYQRLLKQKLATWTSCFRIYRRDQILDLPLEEGGFLGTAELAAQLVLNKRLIVEHPATLEVRLFGFSKMKTVKAILSHIQLLIRIATSRFGKRKPDSTQSTAPA